MRNSSNSKLVFKLATVGCLAAVIAVSSIGCADNPSSAIIRKGYTELKSHNYDAAEADANEFLRAHPSANGIGEGQYLKGRIAEQKAQDPALSPTLVDKTAYLDKARDEYETGLQAGPQVGVRAMLRTGIANVDFYEEDFAGALREWRGAYENLQNDDHKAWVLYRIGLCHQRLNQFPEADRTFGDVGRYYPGSEAATRAAARIGMSGFYVDVARFHDTATADTAADHLRKDGYAASRSTDNGDLVVHVGPLATYADAKAVRARLHGTYPGAVIAP